jgi:hypothetical protein
VAIPTIKVKHKIHGSLVINERDFDPKVHTKVTDKEPAAEHPAGDKKGA